MSDITSGSTVSRRTLLLAGGAALSVSAALPTLAQLRPLRLSALGQALIKHDIRQDSYPDYHVLADHLARADVVFSNLETAINGPGAGPPTRDTEFFHATEPEVLNVLKDFHINLLATGNNHSFDLNTGGILTTLDAVAKGGFAHAGTGINVADAAKPAFISVPAGTVALVAMATGKIREGGAATDTRPGVNEIRRAEDGRFNEEDEQRVLGAIRTAAARADIVIVYQHNHYWEPDFADTPAWLKTWAKRCIDAGAHGFVGHGAPILQGIEIYKGCPLLYGLGSFIFHSRTDIDHYQPEVWDSAIIDLVFENGKVRRLDILPVALNEVGISTEKHFETRGRPTLARGERARRILERLATISAPYGTNLVIENDRSYAVL